MSDVINVVDFKNSSFSIEGVDCAKLKVGQLKILISERTGNSPDNFKVMFCGRILSEGGKSLWEYGLSNGSRIYLVPLVVGGGYTTEYSGSGVYSTSLSLLKALKLSGKVLNRTTNVTGYYDQNASNCYAYAASSAYLNTCARIYKPLSALPSFEQCLQVADYNHGAGGLAEESIRRLEDTFGFGVMCQKLQDGKVCSLKDVLVTSIVISFSTSEQGWQRIAAGSLITKPDGANDGRHATLVEAYDFSHRWFVYKNSWGDETAEPRFNLRVSALDDFYMMKVFFTLSSIQGKTTGEFREKLFGEGVCTVEGIPLRVVHMDRTTALYCCEYLCEPDDSGDPDKWIGYEVDQYIAVQTMGKYYCDKCQTVIRPSARRYHCSACHDYDMCSSCFELEVHDRSHFVQLYSLSDSRQWEPVPNPLGRFGCCVCGQIIRPAAPQYHCDRCHRFDLCDTCRKEGYTACNECVFGDVRDLQYLVKSEE